MIIPPKKLNNSVKGKSLNGYDAIREKVDEDNSVKPQPIQQQDNKKSKKLQ